MEEGCAHDFRSLADHRRHRRTSASQLTALRWFSSAGADVCQAGTVNSERTRATTGDTADSVVAATPDGATHEVVELVTAAAQSGLSPARLGAMLIALGGSLSDEHDLVNLLQRIVEVATEAIDGAQSAGVTILLGEQIYTAVHTDDRTLTVDAEQYAAGDGPCLHAARSGTTVLVDVEESAERWPHFSAAARREGIQSFLAAPLFTADLIFGALNLYGTEVAAYDTLDADILEMLTTTAARAIGDFARFKSAAQTADDILAAIKHREIIEQAKGMLMAVHQIDADDAFQLLRKESQNSNRKLRDVSATIVATLSAPDAVL